MNNKISLTSSHSLLNFFRKLTDDDFRQQFNDNPQAVLASQQINVSKDQISNLVLPSKEAVESVLDKLNLVFSDNEDGFGGGEESGFWPILFRFQVAHPKLA